MFFGPSQLTFNNKIFKYEIDNDIEPVILPDYLYKEILRVYKSQQNIIVKTDKVEKINKVIKEPIFKDTIKDTKKIKKQYVVDKCREERCRIYLDCLNSNRFDDRDDWLTVSAIIFNECKSYDLFEVYSKKSDKYSSDGCIDLWNSFDDEREKKASIKRLIEIAREDASDQIFQDAEIKDTSGIYDT